MKKSKIIELSIRKLKVLATFGFLILLFGCNGYVREVESNSIKEKVSESKEILWNISAIHSTVSFLDIKAIDKDGNMYDVKAIQNSDQRYLIDVKAFIKGKRLPVKMLLSNDEYAPVKAIGEDGTIYSIKAITPEGDKLDVKGVSQDGNIIKLKAISKEGDFYNVKAISPSAQLNDVNGIKMSKLRLEKVVNGVEVFAHIKAVQQSGCVDKNAIWKIKAISLDGKANDVVAIDEFDNMYDVNAYQNSGQRNLMDIKASIGNKKLPLIMLVSEDKYAPVKALGEDGNIYNIKAITPEGDKLDVKGVSSSGNIINIKAIASDGDFYGVKAISPEGRLNSVKGIKMTNERIELIVDGIEVYAYVKAIY